VCFAAPVSAQTPLTLSDAIREALDHHPALAAAAHRISASEGLLRQAGQRPNPRATVQIENLRAWGQPGFSYPTDTDNFAYVSQSFETAGKRAKRIELARTGVRVATLDRQVTAREIASQVANAYWTAASGAILRDLLREDVSAFENIIQYHRDRVKEGAMAEVDLMRVLLERDRLAATLRTAELDATRSMLTLLRSMGRVAFDPVPLAESLPEPVDLTAPDTDKALEIRPDMQAAREAVARARANVELQRAGAAPDPSILFGYKRTAGFDTMMGAVEIDLPLRNRQQGAIAAATAEVRAAESTVAVTQLRIRGELAAAYTEYQSRRRLVAEILRPMRERSSEIARIMRAAYLEGGTDLLRVIDAERARIDSLVAYQRALGELQQAATALRAAAGELP
jgi:cobalt-zinc-cadmium efflux system outer membrane protein